MKPGLVYKDMVSGPFSAAYLPSNRSLHTARWLFASAYTTSSLIFELTPCAQLHLSLAIDQKTDGTTPDCLTYSTQEIIRCQQRILEIRCGLPGSRNRVGMMSRLHIRNR